MLGGDLDGIELLVDEFEVAMRLSEAGIMK